MSRRAIIVVDLQNEYLPSRKPPLVGIDQASANAARVISAARANSELVAHVRHENPSDAPFFVAGSHGAEFNPAAAANMAALAFAYRKVVATSEFLSHQPEAGRARAKFPDPRRAARHEGHP